MSTFVVGDIQGCYSALRNLLENVDFDSGKDTLWAVGDLIGRGEDSLQTLRYLSSLGDKFQAVLGNHDLHFLAISQGIKKAKPSDKFDRLLQSQDCNQLVDWLRQFPLAAKLDKQTLICHAGLYPGWSIKQAIKRSDEISTLLQGPEWVSLLSTMYDNKPDSWHKDLTSPQRQNFIINAFTRMRFVSKDNQLDFSAKGTIDSAKPGLYPWFQLPNEKLKPKHKVIFGHWAALKGNTNSNQHIGLDTGYIWGQSLTLLELERMKLYSLEFKDKKKAADTVR